MYISKLTSLNDNQKLKSRSRCSKAKAWLSESSALNLMSSLGLVKLVEAKYLGEKDKDE